MSNWCPIKNFGKSSWRITYVSRRNPSEAIILFSSQEWPIQKNMKIDTFITNNKYYLSRISKEIPNLTNRKLASSKRRGMTSILSGTLALMICPLALARTKRIKKSIYSQKLMVANLKRTIKTQILLSLRMKTMSGTR